MIIYKYIKLKRNKAFTLAEVLITLLIIGIVASMTIPVLLAKYEKGRVETRLKKFYSVIAQATSGAEATHGNMNTWTFNNARQVFNDYYKDQLLFAKSPYYEFSTIYFTLADGTCGLIRDNGGSGTSSSVKNMYFGINLNCRKTGGTEGVTNFEFGLFNTKNAKSRCNVCDTSCGWPGDNGCYKSKSSGWETVIRPKRSICSTSLNYAWKGYECFIDIMHHNWKITDYYKWEKQERSNFKVLPKNNPWLKNN